MYKRRKHLFTWEKVFSFEKSKGGFIAAEGLFEHLFNEIFDKDFSGLSIPFYAIATDYHSGEVLTLSEDSVYSAVKASMAVPGFFAPVEYDGRLLVDGCLTNNVPSDAVQNTAETIIASDVISLPTHERPSATQVISGAMQVMLTASTRQHLLRYPVDLVFKPNTDGIDSFDFRKIALVLQRGEEALSACAMDLEKLLKLDSGKK